MQEDISYPTSCNVQPSNASVIHHINTLENVRVAAEIGSYEGATTQLILAECTKLEKLHIFDFQDRVDAISKEVPPEHRDRFVGHGNSRKLSDSYCWSLLNLVRRGTFTFDFVFLDGAHTWETDIFAVLLIDLVLRPGGYIELDDFDWTLEKSPTLNPNAFPATRLRYTDEQISTEAVRIAAKVILKQRLGYEELSVGRLFRKPRNPK
ncbi:class I SAM-dependent methyltransferase [Flagellimonas sp.]|uniref:class I SAM-dependent methyltransferase n=1 Tax=Flagellimonas sp. TaxID=2058762 RepID=UPI003AB77061